MIRMVYYVDELGSLNPIVAKANNIRYLHQSVQPFESRFSIGNTVCREFIMEINMSEFVMYPTTPLVHLYEDNGSDTQENWTKIATLYLDDYEFVDNNFARITLVDMMVYFNTQLEYEIGDTVLDILEDICDKHGINLNTTTLYMSDFPITWEDQLTERNFISYVAEVNGGYAYIDENGDLNFASYTNTATHYVDATLCSSLSAGDVHNIGRVYVELASATRFYPDTTVNETLYLNPNNILYNDNAMYPIENVLQHIYSIMNGFSFQNMTIERCPFADARACEMIYMPAIDVRFLCTIEHDYVAGNWYGGYDSQFDTKTQEETQVATPKELVNRVVIKVDRETGQIYQQISSINDNVAYQTSELQQTAESLTARVSMAEENIDGNSDRLTAFETAVSITATGVTVSQGTEGSYTKFTDSGMDIYVESSKVAWAKADGFGSEELIVGGADDLEKWHIHMSNNGNTLTFLKKE